MLSRCLLAALALTTAATCSEAGPGRRRAQVVYQPSYQPVYVAPTTMPSGVIPAGGYVIPSAPSTTSGVEYVSHYTPAAAAGATSVVPADASAGDGLDEVNAKRAARGLRPYLRDEGLTHAAMACAQFRASSGLFGHTGNDFAFLPSGTSASSAGCAAYPSSYGWMSCCVYENYTYAGAAWATGRDGKRYMHIFVR